MDYTETVIMPYGAKGLTGNISTETIITPYMAKAIHASIDSTETLEIGNYEKTIIGNHNSAPTLYGSTFNTLEAKRKVGNLIEGESGIEAKLSGVSRKKLIEYLDKSKFERDSLRPWWKFWADGVKTSVQRGVRTGSINYDPDFCMDSTQKV